MPSKSPAQKRLMQAAAHTKGGFGGVPQKVGKEFVSADKRKPKRMAEGGVASLGNMTSSTPNVPNPPTIDSRDPSKGGYGGQNGGGGIGGNPNGNMGNFNVASRDEAANLPPPIGTGADQIGPLGHKRGGHITTRTSTGSRSKTAPNW